MGTRELDAHVTRVLSWKDRVTETLRKPSPTSSFTKEKPDVQREESALNIALCSSFVTIPGQEDGHAEGRAAGMEKAQLGGQDCWNSIGVTHTLCTHKHLPMPSAHSPPHSCT